MQERITRAAVYSQCPTIYPVLFWDDASGTQNYILAGTGAGYTCTYATASAYAGAKGIDLRTRAAGPAANDVASITKRIPLPCSTLARCRILHKQPWGGPDMFVYVMLYWYTGTTTYSAEVMLNTADEIVYYAATIRGNYTDSGLTFVENQFYWNLIDFSFDVRNGYWHKLRINGQVLDMTAIALASAAAVNPAAMTLFVEIETQAASQAMADFDMVLVTEENP